MNPQEATIANTDLWARYFEERWSRWPSPWGTAPVTQMAEGTAARVANFLTLVAAGPIAWMYSTAAPEPVDAPDAGLERAHSAA